MYEKKFNSERLYKILKTVVLTITKLLLVVVIVLFSQQATYRLLDQQENYLFNLNGSRPDLVDWSLTLSQYVNETSDRIIKVLLVLIGLPTLFFGGTALYRYIFPVKSKNHEDQN